MVVILVIGIVLVGVAAGLCARAMLAPRARAAETLGQIISYGFDATGQAAAESGGAAGLAARLQLGHRLNSFAAAVGGGLSARIPGSHSDQIAKRLVAAGFYRTQPGRFIGYQVLGAIVFPIVWLWLASSAGSNGLVTIAGAIICLLGGWMLPMSYLKYRAERRLEQIDYDMPQLIDSLVTTVEAGIAFGGSLQIAAQRFRGPLAEELRLMLQEQNMGLGINDSLTHMLERCDTPAVRSFVRSIVQGEMLGVSISQTLRALATEMRKRRRQAAEERAHKAPIKMLFPLVFLIFPAMFVILLGPALIRLSQSLGG